MSPPEPVREDHPLGAADPAAFGGAVGLYVHVPFCRSICTYCAFSKTEYAAAQAERWLDGLEREIDVRAATTWGDRPVLDTVFLGGGTPSALTPAQWDRLGRLLRGGFRIGRDTEFTSEANPESVDPDRLRAMVGAGVNRVSLGVQSLDPQELQLLGRPHDADAVPRAVAAVRDAGIDNLNLDLMYGLPEGRVGVFARSLAGVLALDPDHLSAYCLGLEPGTPLAAAVSSGELPEPDDETARRQYDLLLAESARAGYALYEISNVARAGRACRHNLRYWRRESVLALGPSAHALLVNRRWANPAPLSKWIDAYAPGGRTPQPTEVPESQARFEWIFLRLRLTEGLSEAAYTEAWGGSFQADHGTTLDRLLSAGLMERTEGRVRLSEAARFVSDGVLSEFAPGD